MRTLILTCSTGEGHNSCAKAIKEVYDARGERCDIKQALEFISKRASDHICLWHTRLYRYTPILFSKGYDFFEKYPKAMSEGSLIRRLLTLGNERLYKYIVQNRYDSVICTHVFAAVMLTDILHRYPLNIKTSLVMTDYTCYPGVKQSNMDYYFIPDEALLNDFICDNINRSQIIPSGIPIRQMFYHHISKESAKELFDIPADHKHMVMMCGSMGCGHISRIAVSICRQLKPEWDMTVICGTNGRLMNKLKRKYDGISNVHICGYVKNMSAVLDSADVYLTKPGGISVAEAIRKCLPMVFINAVAGCEVYNRMWVVRLGGAKDSVSNAGLVNKCMLLLSDDRKIYKMKRKLEAVKKENAAEIIYLSMKGSYNEKISC